MGLLEEVQRMRQTGMQDDQIILKLQEQGNPYREISEAMSQSKIKQAVEEPEIPLPPMPSDSQTQEYPQENMQEMQPSMPMQPETPMPQQEYFSGYNPDSQTQGYQQNYDSGGLSSDTIMEISEQIVSEKLSDVRRKLEKMSNFKTELETKTEAIEDRLKRIEKIIDTLQASVLRKVGDYVTNVEDIKTELIETQKTFAKVLGQKHQKNTEHHKK
ncbi:hypothetical protein FJZ21_02700 [Candidatus Pacearchaeota archaeon]|nr:hypothetical protein [Candidatus Pacearchaeota archaeon]